MWKKLVLILLLGSLTGTANAGWWHHHHYPYYQAAPVYYAPQAAPQEAPGNRLLEALLPVLIESLRPPGTGTITQPTQPVQSDLPGLKSDLAQLAASVENTNSTLRRHGEELTQL